MSVIVRYAPFGADAAGLAERALDTLADYAPNIREVVTGVHTITPADYARAYGLTEGCWTHGQMGLDQLLMNRPVPGMGGYAAPVGGLYLCGSGTHPGGGVTGAPGYNAAREILKA
jgi:phytoene dehydrogenase-like protein